MRATVWYHPRCNTCRKVRASLEAAGHEVALVEYLKGKVPREEWARLVDAVGGDATRLLRAREPMYKDLKLDQKIAQGKIGREQVIDLLHKHPQLLERPVVEVGERCAIARPAERVQALLAGLALAGAAAARRAWRVGQAARGADSDRGWQSAWARADGDGGRGFRARAFAEVEFGPHDL